MGRINLAALRVRRTAVQKFNAGTGKGLERGVLPNWTDIVAEIPPAQILVRQQPNQHPFSRIRTRSLPNSSQTQQHVEVVSSTRKIKSGKKASRMFSPVQIRYEEDDLRKQFFGDHPWELARPRVVLETTGNQYEDADWSRGIKQPGLPISGESVIQRQLWLLQNVPDLTVPQSYDIARKEFYMLRRAEETRRRISIEEAEHMGATFNKKALKWGMQMENKMYDDWEAWAQSQQIELLQRQSAFSGASLPVEEETLVENEAVEGNRESEGNARLGPAPSDPFAVEARRRSQYNYA